MTSANFQPGPSYANEPTQTHALRSGPSSGGRPTQTSTEFFAETFLESLTTGDLKALSNIIDADPFMNGGRGQEGSTPVVANSMEYQMLVQRYVDGKVHGTQSDQSPLSPDASKAFEMLASWYRLYRRAFSDASETESLKNIFGYLKDTMGGEMKWGICLKADPSGAVQAAFSGQVLEATVTKPDGRETKVPFAWGEHVFVDSNQRGAGLGRETVAGFEEQFSRIFGKVSVVVIEVDNAFGILDRKAPENASFFNHEDLATQRSLWTDPEGQNMAMNPFERLRAWSKLGFQMITVERANLKRGENRVAMPYNQVPLDAGGEPCETLVLAARISDPAVRKNIEDGKWTVREFNSMSGAMQETINEDYRGVPTFMAAQAEVGMLRGEDNARVKLVDFLTEDKKNLNPEALAIMARTADEKLTEEWLATN